MTDNVVPFPAVRGDRSEKDREEHQKALRSHQAAIVNAVREAAKTNAKLKHDDVKWSQKTLDRLIRETKQPGITQEEIRGELKRQKLPARLDRMRPPARVNERVDPYETQLKVAPYLTVIEFCA